MTRSHKIGGCLIEWHEARDQLVTVLTADVGTPASDIEKAAAIAMRLQWCYRYMPRKICNGYYTNRGGLRIDGIYNDWPNVAVAGPACVSAGFLMALTDAERAVTAPESERLWGEIKEKYKCQ